MTSTSFPGLAEESAFLKQQIHSLPPWVRSFQDEALNQTLALGVPQKKGEDWKQTFLQPYFQEPLSYWSKEDLSALSPQEISSLSRIIEENYSFPQEHLVVFINGMFTPALSRLPANGENSRVKISPLKKELLSSDDHFLRKTLEHSRDIFKESAFSWMNQAFLGQGIVVELSEGAVLEGPLHLLYLVKGTKGGRGMIHPRNIIKAHAHSQLQLVETHACLEEMTERFYLNNTFTDLWLGEGSKVDHVKIQLEGNEALHLGHLWARVEKEARYHSVTFTLGGKLSRNTLKVELTGEGASTGLDGLYALKNHQQADTLSLIDHSAPHTSSEQVYKGILDGESLGVFNGKILVRPKAQKITAQQMNKNLLLTNKAHVHTLPQLQISADDVKCTHGATVGQLNEDEIFYLQSRGLSADKARKILSHAFAYDLILKFPHPDWRKRLGKELYDHFEKHMEKEKE